MSHSLKSTIGTGSGSSRATGIRSAVRPLSWLFELEPTPPPYHSVRSLGYLLWEQNPAWERAPYEIYFTDMPPVFDEDILEYDNDQTLIPMDLMETGQCEKVSCCDVTPSMMETLDKKRIRLEAQLTDVKSAIAILEANPGVERVLEAIRKVNRL